MIVKILAVITTGFFPWGGLTTVMMNYYCAMDKTGIKIDFASDNVTVDSLMEKLNKNNSRYIKLPDRKKHTFSYMVQLYQLLKKGKYDVVHIHGNSGTMVFDLFPAYLAKIPKRIIHVHNTRNQHPYVNKIFKPVMLSLSTCNIAVSKEAGDYLYGMHKYTILNNAIDAKHYRFQEKSRINCRLRLGFAMDDYIIGTVGKIIIAKNHSYLVDIFSEVKHKRTDAKLLIIGDGELRANIEKKIKSLGLSDSCILAGMQEDVHEFLSAMDIFVFPSVFEGFGLSLLEAQASGLQCICSNIIPDSACATDLCIQYPLDNMQKWVDYIVSFKQKENRKILSDKAYRQILDKGLEINKQSEHLKRIYEM